MIKLATRGIKLPSDSAVNLDRLRSESECAAEASVKLKNNHFFSTIYTATAITADLFCLSFNDLKERNTYKNKQTNKQQIPLF